MFNTILNFFKPKYLVPVSEHSDAIVDNMMRQGMSWAGTNKYQMQYCFWTYLEYRYGVKQKYKWREGKNYMVFRDHNHYLTFLLKL
jgi:hypothetical protein